MNSIVKYGKVYTNDWMQACDFILFQYNRFNSNKKKFERKRDFYCRFSQPKK